jgi:zinc transport system substrate-binding protein
LPLLFTMTVMILLFSACSRQQADPQRERVRVVTTLFPLYDFVRNVGGENAVVSLLLPPGVEPHNFEPRPEDVMAVAKADLFIFTNSEMEPWAGKLVTGVSRAGRPVQLEAGRGARYIRAESAGEPDHHGGHGTGHEGARDPHVWLDIRNAMFMVDRVAAALAEAAPAKKAAFAANAAAYKLRLQELESLFQSGLKDCATREFIHGGHYAFAYLADRYDLRYISAYGISADSEPSPRRIVELVETIRNHGLKYVFYEELLSPRVAETVAAETGAGLLQLHGLHNLSRSELDAGASYIGLMGKNLAALRKGLICR